MSKLELTAVLEECGVGHEREWRDEMIAAWIASAATAGVDGADRSNDSAVRLFLFPYGQLERSDVVFFLTLTG
jgi:hypothetical protein